MNGYALQSMIIHVLGLLRGWSSPFAPDLPRWGPFSRTIAFQKQGPSTPEAVFPDGQRLVLGQSGTAAAQRPGAAATARPGCGELNPKGSPPRPAVAGASTWCIFVCRAICPAEEGLCLHRWEGPECRTPKAAERSPPGGYPFRCL